MTITRTKAEVIDDIIKAFKDDEELFNACIEELDRYNGYLGDNRYYDMDELDELLTSLSPSELLNRAYYGHAENERMIDQWGNSHPCEFNPNADYFIISVYGNLCSTNYKDYSAQLDEYAVEAMSENRYDIDSIDDSDELSVLFDELEEMEV